MYTELGEKILDDDSDLFNSTGKHPVSALQEICAKKRWDPPHYDLVSSSGPSHQMSFSYKVQHEHSDTLKERKRQSNAKQHNKHKT